MTEATIRRLDFGYFVRPPEETGTGAPRVEPSLGYLIEHSKGVVLFDTGMGDPRNSIRTTGPAGVLFRRRWPRWAPT